MTLYEIDHAIAEAFEKAIDPETGEILDSEAWAELEALQMAHDQKVENIALFAKNLEAEAAAIKAEEEKLKARRTVLEHKAKSLRTWLARILDGAKFATARVAVSWRKSVAAELAPGMDPAQLPIQYQRVKVTVEPDKTALAKALKAGETIEGVELVERNNLQIK